jgi:hypothetical protein
VGWLVPKPFTPLQWMAQPPVEYFREVRERLRAMRGGGRSPIRLQFHNPERSVLEAVFARGDRRLGAVIYEAWKRGARFDGWDETFDHSLWQDAFAATGVDPAFYAHRERRRDELLPWDHIGAHLTRGYLERADEDIRRRVRVEG